ncbi:MAG TPA: hypothetical protein DIW36_09565 [Ruminococcaceae bacterium]|nr:hypothetical protein [Oscillospiraceae bacterium]
MALRGHKFKTSKQDKRGDLMRFFLAFLAFALVFGSISAVVILKHNELSLKSIFSKETTTEIGDETTADDQPVSPVKLSGKTNFLIYCSSNDFSEMYFIHIVEADMDNCIIKDRPLNPDGKTTDGKTYVQLLKESGAGKLVSAIEEKEGVKISKYVGSNAETFALAINYMDGLEYTVDERIEYRNSAYTLILTKGNQTIKGETLIKYFRYCKTLGVDGMRTQGKLICAMLDSYINDNNVDKGTRIYQRLLSNLDSNSDISYFEAAEAMPTVKAFCDSENRQNSTIIINDSSIS